MAKIAVLWENQATFAADKSISKTPSWQRLSQQGRTIILRAISVDTFEPALIPSGVYSGFLTSKSASAAHQNLIEYFDSL